jgi:hypothetical protein
VSQLRRLLRGCIASVPCSRRRSPQLEWHASIAVHQARTGAAFVGASRRRHAGRSAACRAPGGGRHAGGRVRARAGGTLAVGRTPGAGTLAVGRTPGGRLRAKAGGTLAAGSAPRPAARWPAARWPAARWQSAARRGGGGMPGTGGTLAVGTRQTGGTAVSRGGPGDRAGGGQTDRSCPQAEVAAISVFIASVKGRPN